ncbi:MAG TPA: hypothetical protein VK811_01030 [Candidatus Acidoferrum sp.]|nr:hypothetical protein [Candidatus Acidoferrum sp.]
MNNLINPGMWSQSFLWASVFWGAIGSGYFIYGWRQHNTPALVGGVIMSAVACFVPALPMSLICIAAIFGVWWMIHRDNTNIGE